MKTEKRIGKITSCYLGTGGYQDAQFGLSLSFESKVGSWGVGKFISGGWYPGSIDPDENSRWSETDRRQTMADLSYEVARILREAGVDRLDKLVGIPVEVEFECGTLKSWRVLTEVL